MNQKTATRLPTAIVQEEKEGYRYLFIYIYSSVVDLKKHNRYTVALVG